MKILLLGNGQQKFVGKRYFSYTTRFYNGLVRNGHCVYFFDGKEEIRQSSSFGLKSIGEKSAAKKLQKIVENFRPDAIINIHIDPSLYDALRKIKQKTQIRFASINVDALFSPRNIANIEATKGLFDMTFCTTGGSILSRMPKDTGDFYFIPNVTDSSIDTGRAFEETEPSIDFTAVMHEENSERNQIAAMVKNAVPELKISFHGFGGMPGIYGTDYVDLLSNSAMTLCQSREGLDGKTASADELYMYASDRIAHVTGNGSMALVKELPGLRNLYNDDEVIFFNNADELIQKVSYYKRNPRQRQNVAQKGHEKAHRDFNEIVIVRYVIERLFDKLPTQNYAWPL